MSIPDILPPPFLPLTREALHVIAPLIAQNGFLCSDVSLGMLLTWQGDTGAYYCVRRGTFSIMQPIGDSMAFTWPWGDDVGGMLDLIFGYAEANGLPLRFYPVSDGLLENIRRDGRFAEALYGYDERWSDYVYSFEEARTFAGRKFNGQRNHINKFVRLYGEPDIRPVAEGDIPALEAMLDRYGREHADAGRLELEEIGHTRRLLEASLEYGLPAAFMVIDGEAAAFSIGEIVGNMLVIHAEKALKRYEGIYPAMYRGFVNYIAGTVAAAPLYVNREDDSGDPGLRTSKLQYHPLRLQNKYLVHVNPAAYRLRQRGELPRIRTANTVLDGFKDTDRAAYMRLSLDVENNRFWGYDYREDEYLGPIDVNTFFNQAAFDMSTGDSVNFALRLEEGGPMIGEGILWNFNASKDVEVGLRIFPEYHGKGLGREAFRALSEFAEELGLTPNARSFKENAASVAMILGSGYTDVRRDEKMVYFRRG